MKPKVKNDMKVYVLTYELFSPDQEESCFEIVGIYATKEAAELSLANEKEEYFINYEGDDITTTPKIDMPDHFKICHSFDGTEFTLRVIEQKVQ